MVLHISTSCLKQKLSISDMLDLCKETDIKNIELGPCQEYTTQDRKLLENSSVSFTVHHYFPPPEEPFVINLASQDKRILERSMIQLKKSIDFCNNLGLGLFSFHAGFRVDPDINFTFNLSTIPDYEKSFRTFKTATEELVRYAEAKNVKIAVENNEISEYNLVDGKNEALLLCELWEFERLFKEIPSKNLGLLLDLGHLKVSSYWLHFDRYKFIEKLQDKIFEIHIHENNGKTDQHNKLAKNSWCFDVIQKYCKDKNIPIVTESSYSNLKELIQNKKLIETVLAHNLR